MSIYTTTLKNVCEYYADYDSSQGYDEIETVISKAWNKLFDEISYAKLVYHKDDVQIDYSKYICCNILREFYTREISGESIGIWKLWLNNKLRENADYIARLYNARLELLDVFHDYAKPITDFTYYDKDYHIRNRESHDVRNSGSKERSFSGGVTDATEFTNINNSDENVMRLDTPQGDFSLLDGVAGGQTVIRSFKEVTDAMTARWGYPVTDPTGVGVNAFIDNLWSSSGNSIYVIELNPSEGHYYLFLANITGVPSSGYVTCVGDSYLFPFNLSNGNLVTTGSYIRIAGTGDVPYTYPDANLPSHPSMPYKLEVGKKTYITSGELYATNGQFSDSTGSASDNFRNDGTRVNDDSSSYTDNGSDYKLYETTMANERYIEVSYNGKLPSEIIKETAEAFYDLDEEVYSMFKDLFIQLW